MSRSGLPTFLNLAHKFCVLLGRYEGSIRAAIAASSASDTQKAQLVAALETLKTACAAVDAIRVVWES